MIQVKPTFSEDQLLSLPRMGKAELVNGRIIVSPAGSEHGGLSLLLGGQLLAYVREHRLGWAFDSSTGFWMSEGNLRSPDVAFVRAERLRGLKRLPRKYFQEGPDLAAEIISPNDKPDEIQEKVQEYLANGVRLIWIIDPQQRIATEYTASGSERTITPDDHLDGGDVVTGFRMKLADLLDGPDFSDM